MKEETRKYFQNCEYVIQAPGSIFIEGNKYTRKAKVLPVPLYVYACIEKGNPERFLYEEADISKREKDRERDIVSVAARIWIRAMKEKMLWE